MIVFDKEKFLKVIKYIFLNEKSINFILAVFFSVILEVASLLIIYGAYGIISCAEIPYLLIKVVYVWIFYVITVSIAVFTQTMVFCMLKDARIGDIWHNL